jgi:hypothetical protein
MIAIFASLHYRRKGSDLFRVPMRSVFESPIAESEFLNFVYYMISFLRVNWISTESSEKLKKLMSCKKIRPMNKLMQK